ncbi:MAG: hypothetical protein IJB93_03810 [Clostridia bacterium]|nr:hypothetical protein [Clostridia bacterium]
MKRTLAIFLAIIMSLSIAVIPVGAAAKDAATADLAGDASSIIDSIENKDYEGAIDETFEFLETIYNFVHKIVHFFAVTFDFDCPFCDGSDETDEPTTEEPTTEEPTTEEPTTEEPTTEEPTTEEPTTEEPTTEEPTTEEPTTEEPTTEEPTTEEPTTEEPTTEEKVVTYDTFKVKVTNSTLAADKNFNYTSEGLYPMDVDVALYFWNRGYKAGTVTIKNMATSKVNAAVYISDESKGINTINFAGGNYFHSNDGVFKLVVNTTDIPVKIKLSGTNKIGSLTLTSENIGDYIVGPYTVA